jgi:hypothetical protein
MTVSEIRKKIQHLKENKTFFQISVWKIGLSDKQNILEWAIHVPIMF